MSGSPTLTMLSGMPSVFAAITAMIVYTPVPRSGALWLTFTVPSRYSVTIA